MTSRRLAVNINSYMTSKISEAAQLSMKHSIYPPHVSVSEMTSAQALMITLFYSFLNTDIDAIQSLLSISRFLPQLRSSFIGIWLRDDFNFRRKDVAKVLSAVAHFIQVKGPIIPDSILQAICGLEEKYDIFNFFQQNGDVFGQQLLAYMNPLVSRGTEVEPHLLQESKEKWKTKISLTDFQRRNKQNPASSLHIDELDLMKCPPIRPPRKNGLRRSGSLPASSKFRANVQQCLESAVEAGDPTSVEQAIHAGASPNLPIRKLYSSPLLLAASKGLDTILRVLLRYGANVNASDQQGWGPLHAAAHYGHLSSVKILLDAGANSTTGNISPLQIALTRNHKEIAELLTRHISTEV
ncbi:uncharacterized protein [Halyomorpha halys]|uniref:uncharacterized protein n=1 Tax=Halyomorpha halys TaxID=286706 RepID=UPI0006D4FF35|nr:uncharacterized protein LOC106690781 [Halyomorpha halys]XP_014291818.1 uncharacterized protein LOC106690781 [Halyomorpha halys]